MNEPNPDDVERDALEDLLAAALAAREAGGEAALARFLDEHAALASRLREALADLGSIDLLAAPTAELPAQLGEFRIRAQLGAGGMGVVYLAEQTSLGREVALKVVRPELLFFDGARERFRREIDAVARLEHPAIVPILATGTADGIPYYAMPRIRGCSAEAVVKALAARSPRELTGADLCSVLVDAGQPGSSDADGTFTGTWWQAVVRLVRKAALGIHHAHTRGILHRDLKPSNLMLTADGRAIVLDFGLAQARGDARLTRTGGAAGSPAYMAPEQVRGEPADERTDVYGLAATLHCLLALRAPFVAGDPEVLRARILAGTREELGERAAIPTELRLVLDTAMDVERMRRHASANALADDLQAVLDGRPILARALPLPVRLRRFAGRHRALATAAGALVVFLVVLPTVLLWQQHTANAALAAQVRRSDESVRVSVDAVERLLANVASERMRNSPGMQQVAAQMMRDALELFDQLSGDQAERQRIDRLRIYALQRLAGAEASLGRLAQAIAASRRALALFDEGEQTPLGTWQRARVRRQIASVMVDQGQFDEVPALVHAAAVDLSALLTTPDFADQANIELGLCEGLRARVAMANDDASGAERGLRAAVEATARAQHADRVVHGVARINLIRFLKGGKQFDEAMRLVDELLAEPANPRAQEVGWPVERMVIAMALQERARLLLLTERVDEAMAASPPTLAAFDEVLRDYPEEPSAHRLRGAAANSFAQLHMLARAWGAARPLLEAACRDQLYVLARNAEDAEALQFLATHRRLLCTCCTELADFDALEQVARELGPMAGHPRSPYVAARGLLRCAARAEPTRAAALRVEALDLLVEARRRGQAIDADEPDFAPLRDDVRFRQLLAGKAGG